MKNIMFFKHSHLLVIPVKTAYGTLLKGNPDFLFLFALCLSAFAPFHSRPLSLADPEAKNKDCDNGLFYLNILVYR